MRSFHFPGRSPVYSRRAMCACSHPAASLAAIDILKRGGNAVDATIAAAAVLAVVEPQMTGIGGDCFALIAKPGQAPIALNASGRAPAAADSAWYQRQGITTVERTTPHAVTVPGAIDGWARLLADHGTLGFDTVLSRAIELAEEGLAVAPRVAFDWSRNVAHLSIHEGARRHLLLDGKAPQVGQVVRFPALAGTLRAIAEQGRDAFYTGERAAEMVATLKALGGLHTMDDFASQSASYVTPIAVPYGGAEIYELPPNNQGIVALVMLNILSRLGRLSDKAMSAERYHVLMEVARLAYAMRDTFVADPAVSEVPVAHMLSAGVADEIVRRIDRDRRTPDLGPVPRPSGSDTVYLTVVDADGMAVSFINSLFSAFGSGIVTEKGGITLHNRGQGFVLDPAHPNCIAPRKRPMHTLVPAMAMKDGQPLMSFGVMGAAFQPMGHVYVVTNMFDYGMDPQEALDLPRIFFENGRLSLEESVPADVAATLERMGHTIEWRDEPWGGGQIVYFDRQNGGLVGASDPRKDGHALGY
ncbi:MAG: gamma-glutamyltransferase [Hyphomicrobiaceae bacterium]